MLCNRTDNLANENMDRQTTTALNNGERLTDDRRVNASEKESAIVRAKERMNAGENENKTRTMNAGETGRMNGEMNAEVREGERTPGRMNEGRNVRNVEEKANDGGYRKELTVIVELAGDATVTLMDVLRGIKENCGVVMACRVKDKNAYEITMQEGKGKARLMDGFKLKGMQVMAREVRSNELVVSFLNLPPYITDEEIRHKLATWGVKATSPIKRRRWPGTDVADGTRFCKVQFNDQVQSLPYSTKFETLEGGEYFRVIHDRQVKVCRLCIQPGHILRECPEFTCHKCHKQGHYARECNNSNKCSECDEDNNRCACGQRREGERSEEQHDGEEEQQSGAGGGSQELFDGEEEQRGGGGASGEGGDGEVVQMEEDGEEEDWTTVEETPTQAGGEKESGGSKDSAPGEDGGEERRAAAERGGMESGVSSGLTPGQRGGGSGGTTVGSGAGRAGGEQEGDMEDITGSSGDNMEEVVANRKRPMGKREVKRLGKLKKKAK